MLVELLIIIALIVLNGLFAMAEVAIISSRKSKLEEMAKSGSSAAQVALDLTRSPHQLLSTVQIGITLIGILAGVYGGATLAVHLENFFAGFQQQITWLAEFKGPLALGIVIVLITYASIIVGELVPKRLAITHSEKLAILIAPIFARIILVLKPFIWVLDRSAEIVLKILPVSNERDEGVTEEELRIMIDEGTEAGAVEGQERDILMRVLQLGDQNITSLMTPRIDVDFLKLEYTRDDIVAKVNNTTHSWYPVIENSVDQIRGIIHVKDLWNCVALQQEFSLAALMVPPVFVSNTLNVLQLLKHFKKVQSNFALVIDENGGLDGVITLVDVTEAILGELPVRQDVNEDPLFFQREDNTWLVSGSASLQDIREKFDLSLHSDESEGEFHTLAGFLLYTFGYLPQLGEKTTYASYTFEIVDLDGNRIDKVLISNAGE